MYSYIIHNELNQERRENFAPQISEQHINNLMVLPAIMNYEDPITGCADSHKKVISEAKRRKLPFVCILEDDILFTAPGAWRYFLQIFLSSPPDWDIFLGGIYFDDELITVTDTIKQVKRFSSTHCMIVRDTMYDYILECPPGKYEEDGSYTKGEHIDAWISKKGPEKKFYLCWPMVAVQRSGHSDIAGQSVDYSVMLKKYKLFESR